MNLHGTCQVVNIESQSDTRMKSLTELLPELINLRKELHHNPELSGQEQKTARLLLEFHSRVRPDQIIEKIGKTGLAFIFEGKKPGKTLLFRADMDALPIEEDIDIPYLSDRKSLSHKCGHDGHMAILSGLSLMISNHPLRSGRVILLFQPAEETGKGALAVLKDPKFRSINPDYVFALHNLPGYPRNAIMVRNGTFAIASEGILIRLKGHASHAAYPDQGISPLPAIMELLDKLPKLTALSKRYKDFLQLSVTYSKTGRFGFGTIPGTAEIGLTIRAIDTGDLNRLREDILKLTERISTRYYLEEEIKRYEPFPATVNHAGAIEAVRAVALRHGLAVVELEEPLRWSEDFGHFTSQFPGALFGLGAGENHSDLHTWYYDFPDEILETGIRIFYGLIQDLLND